MQSLGRKAFFVNKHEFEDGEIPEYLMQNLRKRIGRHTV